MDMECTGLQFCHSRHLINCPMEFHNSRPGVVTIFFKDLGGKFYMILNLGFKTVQYHIEYRARTLMYWDDREFYILEKLTND